MHHRVAEELRQLSRATARASVALAATAWLGCGSEHSTPPDGAMPDGSVRLSQDELMDPMACRGCHPSEYEEWAGSMHAYASDDPVFTALNQRGQREAEVGSLCVNCHAPMALRTGQTTDGTNLASLPQKLKGITCYFCHSVVDVQGTHDNPLVLAEDGVMRGQFADPAPNSAHRSEYSAWLDRDRWDSSTLCGSCHDLVSAAGTFERVYQEWLGSVFAQKPGGATCSQCHMDQSQDLVAGATTAGAPLRRLHDHGFPAVDRALTDFPGIGTQRQQIQALLDQTLQSALCVRGQGDSATVQVVLDNVAAGHGWPSGAALVRRGWVEVKAFSGGEPYYESGVVAPGTAIASLDDPDLWLMRDCLVDDAGQAVFPWFATKYETGVLPAQVTFDRNDPRFYSSHVFETYPRAASLAKMPDRVELRIRLEAMGLDFIDALIESGDLDAAYRAKIPIYTLGGDPALEWTAATATETFLDERGQPVSCVSKTNLKAQAAKVPAPHYQSCTP